MHTQTNNPQAGAHKSYNHKNCKRELTKMMAFLLTCTDLLLRGPNELSSSARCYVQALTLACGADIQLECSQKHCDTQKNFGEHWWTQNYFWWTLVNTKKIFCEHWWTQIFIWWTQLFFSKKDWSFDVSAWTLAPAQSGKRGRESHPKGLDY